MKLNEKLTALGSSTIAAGLIMLSATTAVAQQTRNSSKNSSETIEQNIDNAQQNIEQAAEEATDAMITTGQAIQEAGEAAQQQLEETAIVVEQRANWGWLGLLGLLGLFGLLGKRKVERVVYHPEMDHYPTRTDSTYR